MYANQRVAYYSTNQLYVDLLIAEAYTKMITISTHQNRLSPVRSPSQSHLLLPPSPSSGNLSPEKEIQTRKHKGLECTE